MQTIGTIQDILDTLRREEATLRSRFAVERIGLFGSWIRGEFGPESDIDILVTFARPSFDHYMDLKFYLEDAFGRTVDLVMESALKPRLRQQVLREVQYAA